MCNPSRSVQISVWHTVEEREKGNHKAEIEIRTLNTSPVIIWSFSVFLRKREESPPSFLCTLPDSCWSAPCVTTNQAVHIKSYIHTSNKLSEALFPSTPETMFLT